MRLPALLLACGLLLGCSSLSTHRGDGLDRVQRIYVEHLLTDNHRLDHAMVAELRGLGYEASCGPLTMLPAVTRTPQGSDGSLPSQSTKSTL